MHIVKAKRIRADTDTLLVNLQRARELSIALAARVSQINILSSLNFNVFVLAVGSKRLDLRNSTDMFARNLYETIKGAQNG